jgi:hypothetical protein
MTDNASGFLLLLAITVISWISLPLNVLYNYYYLIKLHFYLKKNRPELYEYDIGDDFVCFGTVIPRFPRKDWYLGDLGEEDETIKYYKAKLKTSLKLMYAQIALIIVSTSLTILFKS